MTDTSRQKGEGLSIEGWLRPYQNELIADPSRLIAYLKSRQIGISEACLIKAIKEILLNERRDVYFVSTNFNNSKELIRRATFWLQEAIPKTRPRLGQSYEIAAANKQSLELESGSRLIALPCKPSSVRSISGTVYLDEVAHYQNDREVYTAIAPSIISDSSLRLILVSTPFGQQGIFHEVMVENAEHDKKNGLEWSRHRTDVFEAVADGFPEDAIDLMRTYPEHVQQQEFLCKFIAGRGLYFDHETIKKCLTDPSTWPVGRGRKSLGVDPASEHDRPSWVEIEEIGQTFYQTDLGELTDDEGDPLPYPEQQKILEEFILNSNYHRVAVDATGEGKHLAQALRAKFGRTVEAVSVTHQWKENYIPALSTVMKSGRLHMHNNPALRSAFAKIERRVTSANNEIYEARSDSEGHADEFFALLFAFSTLYEGPKRKKKEQKIKVSRAPSSSLAKDYLGYH